jgi:diketogulonate reductase-like aldo/keto reductase
MVNQIRWFIGLDPSDTVQKCAEHDIVVEAYSPFAHGLIVNHPEICSGEDHLQPPSVQRSNAKHYKSNTLTEVKEYPGYAHLLPAQKGWERIADDALAWALEHAR